MRVQSAQAVSVIAATVKVALGIGTVGKTAHAADRRDAGASGQQGVQRAASHSCDGLHVEVIAVAVESVQVVWLERGGRTQSGDKSGGGADAANTGCGRDIRLDRVVIEGGLLRRAAVHQRQRILHPSHLVQRRACNCMQISLWNKKTISKQYKKLLSS